MTPQDPLRREPYAGWVDDGQSRPLPPAQPQGWVDPPRSGLLDDGYLVEPEPERREDGWEELADVIHEARCGPVMWRGDEHVPWTDDHREWDVATAKAMLLLGVRLAAPPPRQQDGTETNCLLEGVHEHPFRGPHRFREWEPGR